MDYRTDLNSDGIVNLKDFSVFVMQWPKSGCESPDWCGGADLDYSSQVNLVDLDIFTDAWLAEEPPRIEYYGFRAEGAVQDKDTELLQVLGSAHQKVKNEDLEFSANTGLTDMRYFNVFGGIPAANYGPAGENIHNVDEFVELDSIITGAKTLALFVLDWCGYDG